MGTKPHTEQYTQADYLEDFKAITDLMYETTRKKNTDYTGDLSDPFKNFRVVEEMGLISAEAGVLVRLSDKFSRMAGFVKNGTLQVADEKIEDTAVDMAVYAIIFALLIRSKKNENR